MNLIIFLLIAFGVSALLMYILALAFKNRRDYQIITAMAKMNTMSALIVGNFMDDFGDAVSPYTLDNFIARYKFYSDEGWF